MSTRKRKTGEERKETIARAALDLFARKGFHGTTTREIADAAGISEALVFRHFKNKEDIYQNVQFLCLEAENTARSELLSRKPSAETLAAAAAILVREVYESYEGIRRSELLRRLQTHSMLEDGRFARAFFNRHFLPWFPFIRKCFQAARRSGDLVPAAVPDTNLIWFVHNLPMMVRLTLLQGAVTYEKTETLLDQMTAFCLRGIGFTDRALARLEARRQPGSARKARTGRIRK